MLAVSRSARLPLGAIQRTIQKGQPVADRVAVLIFMVTFNCFIVLIPIDVFRLHLLPLPGQIVSAFGLLLFLAGWWIIALSFAANTFAIPVVKHQTERQHVVVDVGVYRFVRHPLYGVVLLMIGMGFGSRMSRRCINRPPRALARILWKRVSAARGWATRSMPSRVPYRLVPYIWQEKAVQCSPAAAFSMS
jgi:protein-S-isoprenylcysteine O-methyltransferase Ste14